MTQANAIGRGIRLLAGLALCLLVPTSAAQAQPYAVSWYTVDGGGTTAAVGGTFSLAASIGQPDAGALSGGAFVLRSGFLGADFAVAPTVTTPTASLIGATSATLGGNVTSDGGSIITDRGVVVALTATNPDPQIGGSGVTQVSTTGTTGVFTVAVSGLTASSGYSFKAYATNTIGASYTSVATFTTQAPSCPTITLASLQNGTIGVPGYSGFVTASGGTGPYTYALTSGSLPPGLTRTGDAITGTPSATGTFPFQITATDTSAPGTCTGVQSYSVVIGSVIGAGDLVIREFRSRGPLGAEDEYVEVFNKSAGALTIAATDGSAGFGIVSETEGLLSTIPNGTVIPKGGAFLAANSTPSTGYSLKDYGGTGAAQHDASWTTDVPDGTGIGLFRSASVFDILTTRLDAVGFSGSALLYREGAGLAPPGGITGGGEWTLVRKAPYSAGVVKDTGDNVSDFYLVSTDAAMYSVQSALGTPGPQNLSSPVSVTLPAGLADPGAGANSAPNRVQVGNYYYFRRKITNNTGAAITKLRLRIADLSTLYGTGYNPGVQADGRGIGSSDVSITLAGPTTVTAKGLALEGPTVAYSATGKGAGYNASFTVDVGVSLADGDSVYVNIGFRNVKSGGFYFILVPEILN